MLNKDSIALRTVAVFLFAVWLKWTLKGDAEAGLMFVGPQCELCTNPNWETRSKALQSAQVK
jgi:hypothetical protein